MLYPEINPIFNRLNREIFECPSITLAELTLIVINRDHLATEMRHPGEKGAAVEVVRNRKKQAGAPGHT